MTWSPRTVMPGRSEAAPLPTEIVLPVDSLLPATRSMAAAAESDVAPWQRPYVSEYLPALDDSSRRVWFHFCHGHHMEFLYWEATVLACQAATAAVTAGDGGLGHWMTRVARLVYGSGAMLLYCAAFDPSVYDPCLRAHLARGDGVLLAIISEGLGD